MTVKYKTFITTAGAAKFAAATAGGTKITLTQMAVGDGGGKLPVPDVSQIKLIGEKWRAPLNKISVDARYNNYVVAELVIPPEVGGFWLREMGLYDADGTLVAVANMAESYKPELAEGSGRAQTLRMVIIVSAIESVDLTIDATMVMATQEYVDDKLAEHERSRRHPDATLAEKGFTQLSSATDSESEALAATPKAVKSAYDLADTANKNADARLAKNSNLSDVQDKAKARDNLGLKGAAVLDTGTTAGTVAAGDDARIVNALQKGNNLADVPDKAIARSNLALKTAALCDVQTGRDDVTPGRVLMNGGAIAVRSVRAASTAGAEITDANNLPANAVSFVYASAKNSPGFEASVLDFAGLNQDYNVQLAPSYAQKGLVKLRTKNGDSATWSGWTTFYTTDNKPSAEDTGAVSAQGGNYNKTFRFGRIETLANESNMSALYSVQGGSGTIVSGAEFHWYENQFNIGIIRNASDGTGGFVIAHNGFNRLVIDPNGNAAVAGNISTGGTVSGGAINSSGNIAGFYIRATDDIYAGRNVSCAGSVYSAGALYESGGNVRVYSSNNPPPQQDLSPYATSSWVNQYFLQSIRLAGYAIVDNGNNDNNYATAPGSGVVIGVMQKTNYTAVQYRNLQQLVAGNWINVAVV